MAGRAREKVATRAGPGVRGRSREGARQEGRQLQGLVEEGLVDLIEKRRQVRPRPSVMALYQSSHETFAPLYRKLAE